MFLMAEEKEEEKNLWKAQIYQQCFCNSNSSKTINTSYHHL